MGTEGSRQGEFDALCRGSASNGEVLASDYFKDRIQVFDVAGTFLWQWGTNGSREGQIMVQAPRREREGGVVCDQENHRVMVCGSGVPKAVEFVGCGCGALVTDHGNNRVQVFGVDRYF